MKKKLLLFIAPFLGLIASYLVNGNAKFTTNKNELKSIRESDEDDGIFQNAEFMKISHGATSKSSYNPTEGWVEPEVGIQYATEGEYSAVRFIGAIKVLDKNNNGTINDDWQDLNIRWTRDMYAPDGSVVKDTANKTSTKLYSALNANGTRYSIDDYNRDNGTTFTHFVTYAMRKIPTATHGNDFLTAALYVDDEYPSFVYATRVANETRFAFDAGIANGTHVVRKTSNGYDISLPSTADIYSDRYALKTELEVTAGDSVDFLIFTRSKQGSLMGSAPINTFKVFDFNKYSSDSEISATADGNSQFIHVDTSSINDYSGYVNVYMNKNDQTLLLRQDGKHIHYVLNKNGASTSTTFDMGPNYYLEADVTYGDSTVEKFFYNTNNYECSVNLPKDTASLTVKFVTMTSVPFNGGSELSGMDYNEATYIRIVPSVIEQMNGAQTHYEWQTSNN